jgi:hypothetical protein
MAEDAGKVRLDLNNPVFQDGLFGLQKPERLAALETLKKLRRLATATTCDCSASRPTTTAPTGRSSRRLPRASRQTPRGRIGHSEG